MQYFLGKADSTEPYLKHFLFEKQLMKKIDPL